MNMRQHETEQEPGHTPEIWRYMLSALMMRYGARWVGKAVDDQQGTNAASTVLDVATGMLATNVVVKHASKTARQINNVYREVLALDLEKAPEDVTTLDFLRSKNTLVRDATKNLFMLNLQRGLAAVVPFIGPLGKLFKPQLDEAVGGVMNSVAPGSGDGFKISDTLLDNTTELGLGAIGFIQYKEVNRTRTMFEHIRSFVSKELNSGHVLERHVDLNDIHHMYQSYAKRFQDHAYFKIADRDSSKEANVLIMFDRIAELMNAGYQSSAIYENVSQFKLPHFLSLMGNNLIDTTQPEKTMLFVETMAKHGPKAVKEARKALECGTSVQQLADKYGVIVDMERYKSSFMERHPSHTLGLGEASHGHENLEAKRQMPLNANDRLAEQYVQSKQRATQLNMQAPTAQDDKLADLQAFDKPRSLSTTMLSAMNRRPQVPLNFDAALAARHQASLENAYTPAA